MRAFYEKYILEFINPVYTSRGGMSSKEVYFITVQDDNNTGIGEAGILKGLSIDNHLEYESKLKWVCDNIELGRDVLLEGLFMFPSIRFAVEMAFIDLSIKEKHVLFPSDFTLGKDSISINGLIWMGDVEFMRKQIIDKIREGFNCIKIKIGAIDFNTEYNLIKEIRREFADDIEIRVDANGAFSTFKEALEKLKRLSDLQIHSIEQPMAKGQIQDMARLCENPPLPIALDEELIGVLSYDDKYKLLEDINPQYIILKPSLLGGFSSSQEWIDIAEKQSIGWWITSALEGNIGLSAISQWTYTLKTKMPQGLGTGKLYRNNIECPLNIKKDRLYYYL
ncbi:o-succinylbenzoate synthase [Ichthyobacterium seriolicida]|uniref:Mandelate racemase n=1 Tax=Ichthyobacterium seriolicida TaxID=242600 RepID=A0A1J1E8B3_9FLAO|nr:o-succinylbenzoate synthase [Ichthyobacterium seriolicida]BAV94171.1 mandelate racemase [Ichthyobacterium seriolicida]